MDVDDSGFPLLRDCLSYYGNASQCPYIFGDFTPRYLVHGDEWDFKWFHEDATEPHVLVPQKIHMLVPNTKLIFIFRNPIDRLFSSYKYFGNQGGGPKSLDDFHERSRMQISAWNRCVKEESNVRLCMYGYRDFAHHPKLWSYGSYDQIRFGLYYLYLKEWLQLFPRHQVLILRFEDYTEDPITTLQTQALPFLGMEPFSIEVLQTLKKWEDENKVINIRSVDSLKAMLPETRELLDQFYSPFNTQLATLLEDEQYLWK